MLWASVIVNHFQWLWPGLRVTKSGESKTWQSKFLGFVVVLVFVLCTILNWSRLTLIWCWSNQIEYPNITLKWEKNYQAKLLCFTDGFKKLWCLHAFRHLWKKSFKLGMMMTNTIRRMRFTTKWRAAFRVKSFKAAVIRRKWVGRGGGGGEWEVVVGD